MAEPTANQERLVVLACFAQTFSYTMLLPTFSVLVADELRLGVAVAGEGWIGWGASAGADETKTSKRRQTQTLPGTTGRSENNDGLVLVAAGHTGVGAKAGQPLDFGHGSIDGLSACWPSGYFRFPVCGRRQWRRTVIWNGSAMKRRSAACIRLS